MDLRAWLKRSPVIAILRGVKPEEVESICAALEGAGIFIVEVPLNSPSPLESVERLARRFGNRMLIGAGTLTDPAQVAKVVDVGAGFIVTPHADLSIVEAAKSAGLIAVPGFFNPTEAFALLRAGADGIKLFPANVQGIPFLEALKAVLPPDTIVIPVGGTNAKTIPAWRSAGVQGFGVGSSLYKPGDDAEQVRNQAKALMDAIGTTRDNEEARDGLHRV